MKTKSPQKPISKQSAGAGNGATYDPAIAAKHYLTDAEDFTRYCLDSWRQCQPDVMEAIDVAVTYHFQKTLFDTCTLDSHAETVGETGGFLIQLMRSIFEVPGFFNALVAVAQVPLDMKNARPMAAAMRRGEDTHGPFTLMKFRDSLKEGWTASQALQRHADAIHEEFSKGNVALLQGLAASLKKPPVRSLNDWILNAWLPLGLWEPVSAAVKEERLRQAYRTLSLIEAPVPPWPIATPRNAYPVAKLIATVGSKIERRRR